MPPEVQAVQAAQGSAQGSTAYLNLESGDCHGEDAAVRSLLQAGVSRVVVGLKHPLAHARGHAIEALRRAGVPVGEQGWCGLALPTAVIRARDRPASSVTITHHGLPAAAARGLA